MYIIIYEYNKTLKYLELKLENPKRRHLCRDVSHGCDITPIVHYMIIFSNSTKQVIMVELTVPWEEHTDKAQERKRTKYQELTGSLSVNLSRWDVGALRAGHSAES